jgi:hypothetical protein
MKHPRPGARRDPDVCQRGLGASIDADCSRPDRCQLAEIATRRAAMRLSVEAGFGYTGRGHRGR